MKAGWLPGTGFDAYPWRHPVTESSYINSLANRPYRSTIKTLPQPSLNPASRSEREVWHIGPWSTDLEPQIVDRVLRFKLCGSRLLVAERGYLGWLLDMDRIGSSGQGQIIRGLILGRRVATD